MAAKIVNSIKYLLFSAKHTKVIRTLIKSSYPNGYRNFGPDLDIMMMPLNKKYVDTSKIEEHINCNSNTAEERFLASMKYIVQYIQWDIKKGRKNYVRFGVLLLIELINKSQKHWMKPSELSNYIKLICENWLDKRNDLEIYAKWLLRSNIARNINNIFGKINEGQYYKIPLSCCSLNTKIIQDLCKCITSFSSCIKKFQRDYTETSSIQRNKIINKEIMDLKITLDCILMGLLVETDVIDSSPEKLVTEYILPSLASFAESEFVVAHGMIFHKVKYYQKSWNANSVIGNKKVELIEDNNIFYQGDTFSFTTLIENVYITFLKVIETLSKTSLREYQEDIINNFENLALLTEVELINNSSKPYSDSAVLPPLFKDINFSLQSQFFFPYILTSDICISICNGNPDYGMDIISSITNTIKYYSSPKFFSNNNSLESNQDNISLLYICQPYFIMDEAIAALVQPGETPAALLNYTTIQYCYSLLRSLHRVLCCCPRSSNIPKVISVLLSTIDVILPLYDINGILCIKNKLNGSVIKGKNKNSSSALTNTSSGRSALLLRGAVFHVILDIMCIFSETSQVFNVIRVLVKLRDWCGSCLLDLIRRCQRLSLTSESLNNGNKMTNLCKNATKNTTKDNQLNLFFSNIANPSFWSDTKIQEIANINRKWISGQNNHFHQKQKKLSNIVPRAEHLPEFPVTGSLQLEFSLSTPSGTNTNRNNKIITKEKFVNEDNRHREWNSFSQGLSNEIDETSCIDRDDYSNYHDNQYDSDCSDEKNSDNSIYKYYGSDDSDEEQWIDEKLIELIKRRPISSILNAEPPANGILRRTASEYPPNSSSRSGFTTIWTKYHSAPPKTFPSMKKVCFAEMIEIY
ncbi:hypothetical protein cand_034290 [Cryptosporidium andersoni]|uniref:Uncharacterized protein n=1 Tax=Cryptosporidium andersoni TaxID=117008 RepID=A0A1J4MXX5_9CRYT|nr:hypothetical protein cand_034290 [Cryptosporidium andersoni]